jgi:hypothetical protein
VGTGSILGLSALRPSFLVDVPGAEPRKDQARLGAQLMMHSQLDPRLFTNLFRLDDELDEDVDDDDEFGDDDDDSSEDDEEDDDEEETETWQVSFAATIPLKGGPGLTSGIELPRLAGICQLS